MNTRNILVALVIAALAGGMLSWAANQEGDKQTLVRHIVLFKFKDGTSDEKVAEIEKAFANLENTMDIVIDFEWGTNVSPENLAQGFTHCFYLTFASEKDLKDYGPHPEHEKFKKLVGPHVDKVLVFDYVAQ